MESDLVDFKNNVEVLVCNNGTENVQIPSEFSKIATLQLLSNSTSSASSGRNLLGYTATNEYLLFIDDDTTLAQNYFSKLFVTLESNKDSKCTGFAGWVERLKNNSQWDTAWLGAGFDRYFELPTKYSKLRWACTANLIVKSQAFRKVEGFRCSSIPVGGEDIDFGLRLNSGESYFISAPQLVSYHEAITNNTNDQLQRKAFFYGCSEQWLAKEYPTYIIDTYSESVSEILHLLQNPDPIFQLRGYFLLGGFNQALTYNASMKRISATKMATAL
jgi:hypothetical protein